jgi:hypothetical protein
LFLLSPLLCLAIGSASAVAEQAQSSSKGILAKMLDGPLAGVDDIVFAVRVSGRDHWYVNFGYYSCDYGQGAERSFGSYPDGKTLRGYGDGGRLCRLNLRSGELRVLLDDPQGGVRDPQLHYDGQKILFSYRPGKTATFHLYEINIDGSGLRQLTDGPDDDLEPTYLPDGGIMFCSSRCRRFVNCWFTRVATLYRCDAQGNNVRMISSNNDHDNTPWIMPDGRVLYMRWEYVDRSQVHFHHLWTVNPDGTSQMVWYGNELGGIAMLDAKPIPGSDKVVASFSPGHGRPEHMGHVAVVDPGAGPDLQAATRQISRGAPVYRDPYALSEDCFLAATPQGIVLMDGEGNTQTLYRLPVKDRHLECHEPRPLTARPREPILGDRTDLTSKTGQLVLSDVYNGRNMEAVKPGEIKKLLVLEQLPEPVHFSGGMEPLSIGGTFTMARVLGTVPVEPDGSAYMELPALRSLFFVALDEQDLSIKRMQSFVTLQPGERTSCVGCHEQRSQTAPVRSDLLALQSPPHRLTPIADVPDVLDFPRDIQPILDRHCLPCHQPDRREGGVDLSGDHTPRYTNSYWTIVRRGLVADGRNQPISNRPPRSIGSSSSRLLQLLDGSHYDAKVSDLERKTIRLWIETSATYPGTYAALGCGMYPVQMPLRVLAERCGRCHAERQPGRSVAAKFDFNSLQSHCNLTHPQKSLLLRAPLARAEGGLEVCREAVFQSTSDPAYQALLAAIERAGAQLLREKRFDMPGFRPNKHYIREMQRFGILPDDLTADDPIDVYQTDRRYWKSFWHRPQSSADSRSAASVSREGESR